MDDPLTDGTTGRRWHGSFWLELLRLPSPARVGGALGVLVVGTAGLGLAWEAARSADVLSIFDFRQVRAFTFPTLLTGTLLVLAAGMAHQRRWVQANWALATLGLEELSSFAERLDLSTGAGPPAVVHVALAEIGVIAASDLLRHKSVAPVRALGLAGAGTWALAQGVAAVGAARAPAMFVADVLEMAGAALLMLALLYATRSSAARTQGGTTRRLERLVHDVDVRNAAAWTAGCLGALTVLGVLVNVYGAPLRPFDTNRELTVDAFFSAFMLCNAAALAALLAEVDARVGRRPRWPRILAVFLLFMAADELLALHEKIGYYAGLTGFGQWLLLPLIMLGGVGWLVTLRRMSPFRHAGLSFGAGAAVWVISQAVDAVQGTGVDLPILLVVEDILETTGSSLFVCGLLLALQSRPRSPVPLAPETLERRSARQPAG